MERVLKSSCHRDASYSVQSGLSNYSKLWKENSGNFISDRLTEGFFNFLRFSVKRNSLTICYEQLLSVTLPPFFFTNEPHLAKSCYAIDAVVSSALEHLNTMLNMKAVWFFSIPTPISCVICCLVFTGFCITRPPPFMRKVP